MFDGSQNDFDGTPTMHYMWHFNDIQMVEYHLIIDLDRDDGDVSDDSDGDDDSNTRAGIMEGKGGCG